MGFAGTPRAIVDLVITLWTTTGKPILHEVAGLEVWLPCNDDLVLRVQLLDIFLVLAYNFCVSGNVKKPRFGSYLNKLILVPIVLFWKP